MVPEWSQRGLWSEENNSKSVVFSLWVIMQNASISRYTQFVLHYFPIFRVLWNIWSLSPINYLESRYLLILSTIYKLIRHYHGNCIITGSFELSIPSLPFEMSIDGFQFINWIMILITTQQNNSFAIRSWYNRSMGTTMWKCWS